MVFYPLKLTIALDIHSLATLSGASVQFNAPILLLGNVFIFWLRWQCLKSVGRGGDKLGHHICTFALNDVYVKSCIHTFVFLSCFSVICVVKHVLKGNKKEIRPPAWPIKSDFHRSHLNRALSWPQEWAHLNQASRMLHSSFSTNLPSVSFYMLHF